jgi:hypothetical protein
LSQGFGSGGFVSEDLNGRLGFSVLVYARDRVKRPVPKQD